MIFSKFIPVGVDRAASAWFGLIVIVVLIFTVCGALWFLTLFVKSEFTLAIFGLMGAILTATYQYAQRKGVKLRPDYSLRSN